MRLRTVPLALLAALAVIAFAGVGTASAKSCSSAKYPGDGYFTSLSVKGVSCGAGRKVQKSHYKCRVRSGGKAGRCKKRVRRFRCSERRNRISTEINAKVTCKRGGKRVVFTYQQNL